MGTGCCQPLAIAAKSKLPNRPSAAFDLTQMQRYDPPARRRALWLAAALFMAVLGATSGFLWFAHRLTLGEQLMGAATIVALLWLIGLLTQPRAQAAQRSLAA